jgi:hypothetical protein
MQEPQGPGGINSVGGVNGGYSQIVALDTHRSLQPRHGALPVELRKARTQGPPEHNRGKENHQQDAAE